MLPAKINKKTLANLTTKEQVVKFQEICSKMPQIDVEKDTSHFFGGGMYARMLFRKAGTVIVGKEHKKEHMYMVMQGTVIVTTDGEPKTLTGPCIVVCQPGTKRAVLAVTDATCVMIVKTDCTKVDEDLEKDLCQKDPHARFDIHNKIIPLQIEEQK